MTALQSRTSSTATTAGPGPRTSSSAAVDPTRWPDVATVASSPVRAATARRLFVAAASRLPLRVVEAGGRRYGGGGADAPLMILVRPGAFFRRLGATGTIGFGEAYMAGDWTVGDGDDLADVLAAFASRVADLVPPALHRLRHLVLRRQPAAHDNTPEGARANIHHHYDLSNALFATFLDDSLTYSSALFDGEPAEAVEPLDVAQRRKIDRLLQVAEVGPGSRVLEIGTGWGELALRAARRGARVTTLTLSTAQAELAKRRLAAAGVADRVDVRLQDYRATRGTYDAVVSVEMVEAVGANHWPAYFGTLERVLRPGGKVGLQAITQHDRAVRETRDTYTWIRKYIFPGGQVPSVESITETVTHHTSLRLGERLMFGRHYAETLRRWRERFDAAAERVETLGFDETFRRMWCFYLAYSEAGFRTGYLDVGQFTLTKPG